MAFLRFTIKMTDQAKSWSEKHYAYGVTGPVGTVLDPKNPIVQDATTLLAKRAGMFATTPTGVPISIIGGVLSWDDSQRDGWVVPPPPTLPAKLPDPSLDPSLSLKLAFSTQVGGGQNSYNSRIYLGGVPNTLGSDQNYVEGAAVGWKPALNAYIAALLKGPMGTIWGWKAISKTTAQIPITGITFTTNTLTTPAFLTVTMATTAALQIGGQIKLSKFAQKPGRSFRINGRWLVQTKTPTTAILVRKVSPDMTNPLYTGGGQLIPAVYITVPYTIYVPGPITKHDRGSLLGLSLGRSKRRASTV